LIEKSGIVVLAVFHCAIDNLSNIIKKYDDKFKWDFDDSN